MTAKSGGARLLVRKADYPNDATASWRSSAPNSVADDDEVEFNWFSDIGARLLVTKEETSVSSIGF